MSLVFAGCYTQLYQQDRKQIVGAKGLRPDITIAIITTNVYDPHWSDDPNPLPTTFFYVRIVNIGPGDFNGSIAINYADNWRDIDNGSLPNITGIDSYKIKSGDSITVRIERDHCVFPRGTRFRFLLRTDDYPPHSFDPVYYFGREPIAEVSLLNNTFDFVMP